MKILALITARGGSKRLPGKNIRPLGGKPMIVWSIESVDGVGDVCDILVSTDDEAIAEVARKAGALVPWLRPAELATDTSSSVDVCLHALDWYEKEKGPVDGLLLLQPTSPFRSRHTVMAGIELFQQSKRSPVISFSPASSHPAWCFSIDNDNVPHPFLEEGGLHMRSQDLPPAYVINGAFYLTAPDSLRRNQSFYADDIVPLIIESQEEGIDIDTEWDWQVAETIGSSGKFMVGSNA